MDDMPMEYQGSMAMSAGSHMVPWRFEAYEAIGQNRTVDGGFAREAIAKRMENQRKSGKVALGVCSLATARPDLNERLDQGEVKVGVKRGDIIISHRDLFHRTMDATAEGLRYYEEHLGRRVLNRYSIRYAPGSAKLPNGWLAEWSVIINPSNKGQSLDTIVKDGAITWYPKVWPQLDVNLNHQLDDIAENYQEDAKQKVLVDIADLFVPKPSSSDTTTVAAADATKEEQVDTATA